MPPSWPATPHGHDLVPKLRPVKQRGQPLHELLRREAQNGTIWENSNEHNHSHDIIPHPYISCPARGRSSIRIEKFEEVRASLDVQE